MLEVKGAFDMRPPEGLVFIPIGMKTSPSGGLMSKAPLTSSITVPPAFAESAGFGQIHLQ